MGKPLSYWIKQRHNPQRGIYYVACGQLSRAEAQAKESTLYGTNVLLRYDTEEAYLAKLAKLRADGERVQ